MWQIVTVTYSGNGGTFCVKGSSVPNTGNCGTLCGKGVL